MARRNRVTPTGELIAVPARGLVFGNRGCLHDAEGEIVRRQATRRWIACRLEFRGRQREAMPPGRYTGLFFLDEATAFAAGHRPCAECRRRDFEQVKARWGRADAIDARLAAERGRVHAADFADLPTGAFVALDGESHLVVAGALAVLDPVWLPGGNATSARPSAGITPPTLLALLRDGWSGAVPLLHPSATTER